MAKKIAGTTGMAGSSGRAQGGRTGSREVSMPGEARGGEGQRRQAGRGRSTREDEGVMAAARGLGEDAAKLGRRAAAGAADVADDVVEVGEESGRRVVGWVRENPWPTLLIGAGAAWLAYDAMRGREETDMERRRFELDEEGPGRVRRSMSSVADLGRRSVSTVADAGRGAGEQVSGFVRENPMWAGLAALGIGLAVGMTLPSTMTENRVLGTAREKVVRKARQVADSAAETVREVAKGAGQVAKGAGRIAGSSQAG
jgi:hypothetical protein